MSEPGRRIPIATALGGNFLPGTIGTLASTFLQGSSKEGFRIYILDGGIRDGDWEQLVGFFDRWSLGVEFKRLNPDLSQFAGLRQKFGSFAPYARLLLPELTDEREIIYLDSDLLILRDLRPLWDTPLDVKECAAVVRDRAYPKLASDCPCPDRVTDLASPYFNSGVMKMDLDRWREMDIAVKTASILDQYDCRFFDQTALNVSLEGKVRFLDGSWNRARESWNHEGVQDEPQIIHFTADKPWMRYRREVGFHLWYEFAKVIGLAAHPVGRYGLAGQYLSSLLKYGTAPLRAQAFRALSTAFGVMRMRGRAEHYRKAFEDWRQFPRHTPVNAESKKALAGLRAKWAKRFSEVTEGTPGEDPKIDPSARGK